MNAVRTRRHVAEIEANTLIRGSSLHQAMIQGGGGASPVHNAMVMRV